MSNKVTKDAISKLSEITKILNSRDTNFTIQGRYLNKLNKIQRELIQTNDIYVIQKLITELGDFLKPSRILLYTTDSSKTELLHQWFNEEEGLSATVLKTEKFTKILFDELLEEFNKYRFVHSTVKELPPNIRGALDSIKVKLKSFVALPVYSGSQIYGVILITENLVDDRWPSVRLEFLNALQVSISLFIKGYEDHKRKELQIHNLRNILNTSLPCIIDNKDGTIIDVNEGFVDMIGYTREDLVGKTWSHFLANEGEIQKLKKYYLDRQISNTSVPKEFTTKFITKNKNKITAKIYTSHVPNGNIYSNLIDLTKYETSKQALKLVNSALGKITKKYVITNLNGVVQFCSKGFADIHNYDIKEILGVNTRLLKSGEHPPEYYENLWNTIQSGETWEGELINLTKNKTLVRSNTTIQPLLYGGSIIGYLGIKE